MAKSKANIIVGAIVALVLVIAIALYVSTQLGGTSAGALRAIVHDADGAVYELPLSADQERTITTSLGTNVVVVQGGSVYVREADCDNQDCVHQGKIDAPGRQIICLPHKLWIEVVAAGESGSADMNVDEVAGDKEGFDVVAR